MSLATLLRTEIVRLAARTARQQLASTKRQTSAHRRQIAALRKQVAALEREVKVNRFAAKQLVPKGGGAVKARFVAKGLTSLRKRLGLSANDFGRLVGVSGQSVYAWESKKAAPRAAQVASIAALRNIGKREAQARLELIASSR